MRSAGAPALVATSIFLLLCWGWAYSCAESFTFRGSLEREVCTNDRKNSFLTFFSRVCTCMHDSRGVQTNRLYALVRSALRGGGVSKVVCVYIYI